MLKTRAGFTLTEAMVALVLTAVIGAAVTGVFVTQSQFFDKQEKIAFARGVSRGATNIIISELRMLDQEQGVEYASGTKLTVRVPIALGVACNYSDPVLTLSRFPADPAILADGAFSGVAVRQASGSYQYEEADAPTAGTASLCAAAGISVVAGGVVQEVMASGLTVVTAAPVLYYQLITYEFKDSEAVPGHIGLWRMMEALDEDEELLAPFDANAKFRFYVDDAVAAQEAAPSDLATITGVELVLDGLSERPNSDGTFQRVPLVTSVYFKNRQF
jgi:type II secretory pathway pseudopilin PulG